MEYKRINPNTTSSAPVVEPFCPEGFDIGTESYLRFSEQREDESLGPADALIYRPSKSRTTEFSFHNQRYIISDRSSNKFGHE